MAWAFVGVSNVVEVTGTAHALVTTGISGTLQAGDLLVACISSRIASTTSITLPTGGEWTLVSEQKNNNTLATGSAASSGLMAFCIRGASNPDLTFTHPTAPSVAIGRIIAYRDVSAASPKDTQTSFTTATGITAVSGTGLTTTVAGDLIVAMAAGGQEAAWSSFNATSPSGASGATSTAAPTTTWLERADSVTTTGPDTSLGIFDAIKTAIGATGNLTATASVAAAHVVIAGAFKITPPTADAWNRDDKSAAITLSNSDKTATLSSAVQAAVRSSTTRTNETAGKYYAELLIVNQPTTVSFRVGIQNNSTALITTASGSFNIRHDAVVFINSTSSSLDLGANLVTNDVVCVAWDAGAELVWFRVNNGLWNNNAGADPSAGTGGSNASSAAAATHSLWFYGTDAAQSVTLRTESAEFTYSGPSGFTSWMGEALPEPSITGTGALAGQASAVGGTGTVGTADAWNAGDKSENITLSNSDKTATLSSIAVNSVVRSTQQILNGAAGKYYAELLVGVLSGNMNLGVKSASSENNTLSETIWVAASDGQISFTGPTVLGSIGSAIVSGNVVCIAWNAGAELIWFRKNNGLWNDDAAANPATGTNGLDASGLLSSNHCLWFSTTNSENSVTLRTELADFAYSGPSGFTSWMGEALPEPSITGTGTPAGQAGDADGTGISSSAGTGALPGAVATLAGEGTLEDVGITGTGALTSPASVFVSAGSSSSTGTGTLAGQASAVSGVGTSNTLDAWNTLDKSANITLSNSDKTATLTAAVTSGVRSTTKYLNGTETKKLYAEFLLTNAISGFSCQVGIREVSAALNTSAGSTFQCATNSGNIVTGSATTVGNIGGAPLLDGDVVCMAWVPSTERGWFRKNNGLWNNDAAANPATNTNGFDISALNNTDHALLFLAASSLNGASVTIRTEVAELAYTIPSGFTSWMGEALSATGTGALAAQASTVAGTGSSVSIGTGSLVAGSAEVAGTGTAAAANSGALVAEAATVAGLGASGSVGIGALQAGVAAITGAGLVASVGTGDLVAGPATVVGEGVVIEEGVAVGTGALVAGAATVSGEGEVTGEVAPPISAAIGGHWRPEPDRPPPVEGVGYAILPQIEGEAHGVVLVAGAGAVPAPRIIGAGTGAAGVAGHAAVSTLPTAKAAAIGVRGTGGTGAGVLKGLSIAAAGAGGANCTVARALIKLQGAAIGQHSDDEAAILVLLAA